MKKKSNSLKNTNENLDFYIQKIKNIPILSKEEEYNLAKNFKEKNDINAAKKLIESNISYVIKIAKNYSGYGITMKDLIQEGLIGLMKAVKKFDPEKKHRLVSFAIYWIKSEIQEYIIRNLRIVKIASTKTQKRIFFNLKNLNWLNNKEKNTISNFLRAKKEEIDHMKSRLNNPDISLTMNTNNEENTYNLQKTSIEINHLPTEHDPSILIEKKNWKTFFVKKLKKAIYKLDTRSQDILKNRWLIKNTNTLKSLAKKYNISSERVRQLENNAIKKLKILINSDI